MLKTDIDAILAYVPKEGDPALTLEHDQDSYWVRLLTVDGHITTQTRYDTLKQALIAYAALLPTPSHFPVPQSPPTNT